MKALLIMPLRREGSRCAAQIVVTIIIALACTALLHAQEKPSGDCTPGFPFKQSWWGADAAYSIPLPDGRSVWIFGDTLYGDKRVVDGNDPRMVRNSIGISTCKDGVWAIDYVIRQAHNGQPEDFFHAQHPHTWYWALDGFFYHDDLWITLLCVRNSPRRTPAAMDFETCGTDVAKISGLENDPQRWSMKYFPLVPDGVHAYPSATAVVEGEYAYIFALLETGSRPMLLTRIPLNGLDAPAEHLQYLSRDGFWKAGLKPADAAHVMKRGNTEMTVRYHPLLKEWVAVMNDPNLSTGKIVVRTAPQITGPWSPDKVVYRIPEMQKSYDTHDKEIFCYAAKEHPELRRPGSLLITYACNAMKPQKLTTDLGIYFPKVVRVPFP